MSEGRLPSGWIQVSLEEVLPISYGKSLTESARDAAGKYEVFGSSGVVGKHSACLTSRETLIIGRKGSVGQVYFSSGPCWPIDTVYFVESTPSLYLRFYLYLLRSLNLGQLDRSTAIPGLSRNDFYALEVSIPPLAEQHRIVAAIETHLTRLDASVAALKRAQANLKRYRTSVLRAACEGRLIKSLETIEDWPIKTVEELGIEGEQVVLTGPFGSSLGTDDFILNGIPVLTIGCLTNAGIRLDKAMFISEQKAASLQRYRLVAGDLLFSRMASVGRAGLVPEHLRGALINYHIMRLRLSTQKIDPNFFLVYVRGSSAIEQYIKGVNHGATRDGINTQQLLAMPVRLPSLGTQRFIVAEVERRLSVVEELEETVEHGLKRAEKLRQAILRKAFAGELVPQDPNDEPASVLLERIKAERAANAPVKGTRKPRAKKGQMELITS